MQADIYLKKAQAFGSALDRDDFETAESLLTENCAYDIGGKISKITYHDLPGEPERLQAFYHSVGLK